MERVTSSSNWLVVLSGWTMGGGGGGGAGWNLGVTNCTRVSLLHKQSSFPLVSTRIMPPWIILKHGTVEAITLERGGGGCAE